MRSREEIEEAARAVISPDINYERMKMQRLTLEVLLGIRDLLEGISNSMPVEPIEINIKNDYS